MSRMLLGAGAVLVALLGWLYYQLDTVKAEATLLASANETLAQSVGELDRRRRVVTVVAAEREDKRRRLNAVYRDVLRELEDERAKNSELRAHLGRPAPELVVDGLLRQAGQGDRSQDGTADDALPEADSGPRAVSVGRVYAWCGQVVLALRSCNADKAAVRREVTP